MYYPYEYVNITPVLLQDKSCFFLCPVIESSIFLVVL